MRLVISLLILAALSSAPVHSANILYISPLNATSHYIWNTVLATELAVRGNHVTYITVREEKSSSPNLERRVYSSVLFKEEPDDTIDPIEQMRRATIFEKISSTADYAVEECEGMFNHSVFKNLIDPKLKESYDVIVYDDFNLHCILPFGPHFNAPIVAVSALLLNPYWLLKQMGTPLFHAHPHVADDKQHPLNLWGRLQTLGFYFFEDWVYNTKVRPVVEEMNRKNFGEKVLPISELAKTWVAVALVNIPPWINKIPLPSNVIPVGGLHMKEPKPLESKVKKFLDEAKNGAVLISFGSLILTENLEEHIVQEMISAFGKVPYRFVWKWDPLVEKRNFTIPKNIMRVPWVAQTDVLGHPNMRLFVSHCGGQSSVEAVYRGVPVLAIPVFWDQFESANRFVVANAGIRIDLDDVTEANLLHAIKELTENKTYIEGMKSLQSSLRDQPVQPLDLAVFWIEFVARHHGAPHLRPFLWDLPFHHILLLDIVVVTLIGVSLFGFVVFVICSVFRLLKKCFVRAPVQKMKKA